MKAPGPVIVCLAIAGSALGLGGCLKRTITITTEPPGALVWLNDVEVGRTPLETDFTFYGTYDVRVTLEGYESLQTHAKAGAPIYEIPPFDLVAEAIPVNLSTVIRWHFDLKPLAEAGMSREQFEAEVVRRAREQREKLAPQQP